MFPYLRKVIFFFCRNPDTSKIPKSADNIDISWHSNAFFQHYLLHSFWNGPDQQFSIGEVLLKKNHFFLEFFHQGLNRQFYTWGGPFNRKVMGLDPCVGILINPKAPKNIKFDISRFSNSYFSMPIGLTSFIRILIDSFFLSVEWLLNRNSFVFAKATDFSLLAESIEKCYCQCNSVDIQIHRFLKLSAWILPTRSQSTTFFLVKILVKILCCVFHHTIRLRLLSKNNLFFFEKSFMKFCFYAPDYKPGYRNLWYIFFQK